MKSKILVFIQFFVIFLMVLPFGTPTNYFALGMSVTALGLLIGVAALWANKLGNFNIVPDIKEECTLITSGIYAYIRHPMYASVLLSMLGVMILYFGTYELVLFMILCINMLTKMLYEEKLWHCEGIEYEKYTQNTKRLIPYIY